MVWSSRPTRRKIEAKKANTPREIFISRKFVRVGRKTQCERETHWLLQRNVSFGQYSPFKRLYKPHAWTQLNFSHIFYK